MPMSSKILAASLLACKGLAVSVRPHSHGNNISSYHPGEFVECFDNLLGQWKTSVYIMAGGDGAKTHSVALWDEGAVPGVPDSRVRRFKPFAQGEAVEVLDLKSNEWNLGTAVANGTQANTYEVELQRGGQLTVPKLLVQRPAKLKQGDRVRYFLGGAQFWREGSVDGVVGEEDPRYNLTVEGAGGRKLVHPSLIRPFEVYSTGDQVQFYDKTHSRWLEGGVVQEGDVDDTYKVSILGGKFTKQFPGDFLQRSKRSRGRKPDTVYGDNVVDGEVLEFLDDTMTWAPCKTSGPGKEPFTYTCTAPLVGKMENVSVMLLRKAPHFQADDVAEAFDRASGVWQPVQVLGEGSSPFTYNVQIPFLRTIKDLPAEQIRRFAAPVVGEQMEVVQKGTDHSTGCKIVGPGKFPHTYYVSIPGFPRQVLVNQHRLQRRGRTGKLPF